MQDIFVFLDLKVFNTDNSYMVPGSRFKHFDPFDPDPSTLVSSIQRIKPQMCLHTAQTYAMFGKSFSKWEVKNYFLRIHILQ